MKIESEELAAQPVRMAAQIPTWLPPRQAAGSWLALMRSIRLLELDQRPVPCASHPEWWWSSATAPETARAVDACGRCPVLDLCRAYAVTAREQDGVWGGTTPLDRGWVRRGGR